MSQPRHRSALESVANVAVGYGLAVATQALVFPLFGLDATAGEHAAIGLIFTAVSLVRSYTLRRIFNTLDSRRGCEACQSRRRASAAALYSLMASSTARRGVSWDA